MRRALTGTWSTGHEVEVVYRCFGAFWPSCPVPGPNLVAAGRPPPPGSCLASGLSSRNQNCGGGAKRRKRLSCRLCGVINRIKSSQLGRHEGQRAAALGECRGVRVEAGIEVGESRHAVSTEPPSGCPRACCPKQLPSGASRRPAARCRWRNHPVCCCCASAFLLGLSSEAAVAAEGTRWRKPRGTGSQARPPRAAPRAPPWSLGCRSTRPSGGCALDGRRVIVGLKDFNFLCSETVKITISFFWQILANHRKDGWGEVGGLWGRSK